MAKKTNNILKQDKKKINKQNKTTKTKVPGLAKAQ
jgi:hypothetical protein